MAWLIPGTCIWIAAFISHGVPAQVVPPCGYIPHEAGAPLSCGWWGPSGLKPAAMNAKHHWVGQRYPCPDDDGSSGHAIRWDPTTGVVDLPVPPGTDSSWAWDINDSGMVVGARWGGQPETGPGKWACVWDATGQIVLEIPALDGCPPFAAAAAINNHGVVVGYRDLKCGVKAAFIWKDGVLLDIDPRYVDVGLDGLTVAYAEDVSDSGTVVGGLAGLNANRAFSYMGGHITLLPLLPGAVMSEVHALNETGQIVGTCGFGANPWTTNRVPVLWEPDGAVVALPLPPGYVRGHAKSISENGEIFGTVVTPSGGYTGTAYVVWRQGIPVEISSLMDPDAGEFLTSVRAMSSTGDLIGNQYTSATDNGVWVLERTRVPADLTDDCVVTGEDLQLLLAGWGSQDSGRLDLTGDGLVSGGDVAALLGAWSGTP